LIANGHRMANANLRTLCRLVALAIAASVPVLVVDPGRAGGSEQGAQLAAICASCHRLDGHDKGIPSIVGLDEKQFVATMAAFKSGVRSSQIMHAIALVLSDGEIATLADYLAALPRETKPR
jgi:cytochrome subunit of sulfide dehydrogenase